ncbi:MAG: type I restriction enzyme HsdR N-terminal domain-containing protein [Paludibacteraceae bacterium]
MLQLNLPTYQFRIKQEQNSYIIWDSIRNKYVKLTPEEWVRQHFLQYFMQEKQFPKGLLSVEQQLNINGMKKRCDAVFYNRQKKPEIILEFKAPTVEITQAVFDQVAVYNSKLSVRYFVVSNGISHYFCRVNTDSSQYEFFSEIPDYNQLFPKYLLNFVESLP